LPEAGSRLPAPLAALTNALAEALDDPSEPLSPRQRARLEAALRSAAAVAGLVERAAEYERDLRRERTVRLEAEATSRAKDEFIAMISHELRTPLGAILIWTQLLRNEKLDESATARALGMVERSTKTLVQLIDDLLDVSRIVAGKLNVELRPVDLASVVDAAVASSQLAAEAKGLKLQYTADRPLDPVSGDASRLQQVVGNLLANAVKFTPDGGSIDVRLEDTGTHARISVRDTGMGIRPDFLPYIFERFRQADSTITKSQRGLGLGLAIARHLVERHGGSIEAESAGEGKGSTFRVTLPKLRRATLEEALEPRPRSGDAGVSGAAPALQGLRILVVDDDADAREGLTVLLEQWGGEVTAVGSAAEALEILDRARPHVLLSDIAMPGEDGYALIKKVRMLSPDRGGRVPAAALTAYATAEDRIRSLTAGYHEHLPKPVEPNRLLALVLSLARLARGLYPES
jgi:signal transduction histidine kinase/ActR/RegA family two-component response regulator